MSDGDGNLLNHSLAIRDDEDTRQVPEAAQDYEVKPHASLQSKWEASKSPCPLWVRWPRFWLVLFVLIALVAVSIQNVVAADAAKQSKLRASLEDLANTYAREIRTQVVSSLSSLDALDALVRMDDAEMVVKNFQSLADTLISSYGGISNLQLAPAGRVEYIHPLVDETQDNTAALSLNLLLDPVRSPAALDSIRRQATSVIGPVELLQGGIALIARRPIFTCFAPQLMPDAWYETGGKNYSRICSKTPPDVNCSFPGPPEVDGAATYFWGFVTMLATVEELVKPVGLKDMSAAEYGVGLNFIDYQLQDLGDAPVELYTWSAETLDKPLQAAITLPGIHWILKVAPRDGWPMVSGDFWKQLLVVLPMTAMLGLGLGMNILIAMWKRAHQIQRLEEYRRDAIGRTILASVNNLSLLQFPMCLLKFEDFINLGQLVCHEDARAARKLRFIEQVSVAADLCQDEGVAFISHQWAGFEDPDPDGVQYRTMVIAVKAVRSRGLKCDWIWLDYSSIPQRNAFQQQTAINSLSVYASYCSIFLSVVPPCKHADNGMDVDVHSYSARAWCRLEKLSYGTSSWKEERIAYLCTEEGITDDWAGIFNDESVLDVLGGTFSCCTREHPDGRLCDKQKIVGVMLGVLWRLYATCRDAPKRAHHAETLLGLISQDEQRYFPRTACYKCTSGKSQIQLFDGYLPVLRAMFLADSQAACEERVAVPGVSDPWLTSSMTLAPVQSNSDFSDIYESPLEPTRDHEDTMDIHDERM